jgi:hypothetical protein
VDIVYSIQIIHVPASYVQLLFTVNNPVGKKWRNKYNYSIQ